MVTRNRNRRAASRRQQRVGEAIRRILGEMLLRQEIQDPELNRNSITITEVRISADMREATVFFLPLGGRDAEMAGRAAGAQPRPPAACGPAQIHAPAPLCAGSLV